MVSHRVCTEGILGVFGNQIPHLKLIPRGTEALVDIHIRELNLVVLGHVDLDITTALEVQGLTLGEFHNELLHEGRNATVRDNLALPFLNTQNAIGNLDFHILLNLHLATQTPVLFLLTTSEEVNLGRQNIATALHNLATAHTTRATATTSRRKENLIVGKRRKQSTTSLGSNNFLATIDVNGNTTRFGKFCLRKEQKRNQQQQHYKECYD